MARQRVISVLDFHSYSGNTANIYIYNLMGELLVLPQQKPLKNHRLIRCMRSCRSYFDENLATFRKMATNFNGHKHTHTLAYFIELAGSFVITIHNFNVHLNAKKRQTDLCYAYFEWMCHPEKMPNFYGKTFIPLNFNEIVAWCIVLISHYGN